MNALSSATTLPWRDSAAFNARLNVGDIDPVDVYEFIGRSTFDASFRARVLADAREVLGQFRLPGAGTIHAPALLDARLGLDADEMAAIRALSETVQGGAALGERATERAALREGVGMPAIAALVAVVAVAVFVFVFLYAHQAP